MQNTSNMMMKLLKLTIILLSLWLGCADAMTEAECEDCPVGWGIEITSEGVYTGECQFWSGIQTTCAPCQTGTFSNIVDHESVCNTCSTGCHVNYFMLTECNSTQNIVCEVTDQDHEPLNDVPDPITTVQPWSRNTTSVGPESTPSKGVFSITIKIMLETTGEPPVSQEPTETDTSPILTETGTVPPPTETGAEPPLAESNQGNDLASYNLLWIASGVAMVISLFVCLWLVYQKSIRPGTSTNRPIGYSKTSDIELGQCLESLTASTRHLVQHNIRVENATPLANSNITAGDEVDSGPHGDSIHLVRPHQGMGPSQSMDSAHISGQPQDMGSPHTPLLPQNIASDSTVDHAKIICKNCVAFHNLFKDIPFMHCYLVQNGLAFVADAVERGQTAGDRSNNFISYLERASWNEFIAALKSVIQCPETWQRFYALVDNIESKSGEEYAKMIKDPKFREMVSSFRESDLERECWETLCRYKAKIGV